MQHWFRSKRWHQNLPDLSIQLTLLCGLGISITIAIVVGRWEQTSQRLELQQRADNLTTALQRSFNRYTDVLLALGDFYQVEQLNVSRSAFNQFVQRPLRHYPGIQALEWAPQITAAERDAFERTIQAEGFQGFEITEQISQGPLVRAGDRSHYVPVTYLQPIEGNELAFGYDLASDPTRQAALLRAKNTGELAASGRIRLVQEDKDQYGFLIFLPLYQQPTSLPQQANQEAYQEIRGYLLGVFRVADVVEESLQALTTDIDFVLYDQSAAPAEQFLGFYDATTQTLETQITRLNPAQQTLHDPCLGKTANPSRRGRYCNPDLVHSLKIARRQWQLIVVPSQVNSRNIPWSAVLTLITGVLLTIILANYLARSHQELTRTRELSDLKLRLFSMASHEFRTPLSTILVSAQSLEVSLTNLSEEQTLKVYSRIRTAAKRMTQLLNDLLTLTRAEAGKLDCEPELLNLQIYCQQLLEEIESGLEVPRALQLQLETTSQQVFLDPKLLRSILTNLISNALKYSEPNDKVILRIYDDTHYILFAVSDRGIGIPEADQTKLYEAFYRGSNVGDISGTGLGLAVVQSCLQLHSGTLSFSSKVGEGTTFTVKLPRID